MEKLLAVIIGIGIVIFISILSAWPVQLIWNDLFPSLFELREISFLEALEINVLCSLLFKGSTSTND